MRIALLLIAVLACHPATAGKIYKCVDASGAVTYTNIQCPNDTKRTAETEYRAVADAPSSQQFSSATQHDGLQAAPSLVRRSAPPEIAEAPRAYQCSTNNKTRVQTTPCPLTYERTVHNSMNGDATVFGSNGSIGHGPVHGTVPQKVTTPIREEVLSRDALCDRLASNIATARTGDDSDSAYERNKLRAANGCH